MFRWRKKVRKDEEMDISRIVPKVEILNQVQDDGIAGLARNDGSDIVERFSVDLEERLKCNMGQVKEDATMLEKLINNKL